MSPTRTNTAPSPPDSTPTTRNRRQRTTASNQRRRPSQPTIWNFIRKQIQSRNTPDNNSSPNTRTPSETQEPELPREPSDPPVQTSQNDDPIILTDSTQDQDEQQDPVTRTHASVSEPPNRHNDLNTLTHNPEQLNPTTHQRTLPQDRTNEGWGDIHHYAHPQKHF